MENTETYEQARQREQEEKDFKIKAAEDKARKVLKILGFTYKKADENFHEARTIGVKGASEIWITSGGYSIGFERYRISGHYPRDSRGGYVSHVYDGTSRNDLVVRPEITVSAAKTPEQIANDITRRFLPDHEKYLAAVQKSVKESNDYQDKSAKALEFITGQKPHPDRTASDQTMDAEPGGEGFGSVRCCGTSVTLELRSLTPEQAKAALEAARKAAPKGEK